MSVLYVFRHVPSGAVVTIPAEWSKVGYKEMVLDEVEAKANKECSSGEAFSIIGCIDNDPFPDEENWLVGRSADKLPDGWEYDIHKPSYKSPVAKVKGLRPIPEKDVDRNEFNRQGLLTRA